MLWLTWRQHRAALLTLAGLLVGWAAVLAATYYFHRHGVPGVSDATVRLPGDMLVLDLENMHPHVDRVLMQIPYVAIPAIAAFCGAPLLAREYERRTFALAWTQSVSRTRWYWTKTVACAGALALLAAVVAVLATWWYAAAPERNLAENGLTFAVFERFSLVGVAPVAWALAAFAVGVASGAVVRRVVPAMALAAVLAVGLYGGLWIAREGYAPPMYARDDTLAASAAVLNHDNLITGYVYRAADGRGPQQPLSQICDPATVVDTTACLRQKGYAGFIAYHPRSRFWPFQWIQAGILAAVVAAGLVGPWLLVRRRRR